MSLRNRLSPNNILRVIRFAILVAVLVGVWGCSSSETVTPPGVEEMFQKAMDLFKDEDYLEAFDAFRAVTLQYQGSGFADDAQFYMGECQFRREEYILAAFEYETLVRTMPTSEFVPEAEYQVAMCYYRRSPEYFLDQEYTVKAIDAFQAFLEYHPTDPRVPEAESRINELNTKLALKEFESGNIYMKMQYYRAATVSFDFVLEKYHDTPYAEPALLRKGESLFARRKYRDAKAVAGRFLEKYPSSTLLSRARALLEDSEEELKKETQTTGKDKNSRIPGSL